MSITHYGEPEFNQIDSKTSIKSVEVMTRYYSFVEEFLVQENKEISINKNFGTGMQRICTENIIVFYKFRDEYLDIYGVVDLNSFEILQLTKKQELAYFKFCCEMQTPPIDDLEIEVLDSPKKRKVYFKTFE